MSISLAVVAGFIVGIMSVAFWVAAKAFKQAERLQAERREEMRRTTLLRVRREVADARPPLPENVPPRTSWERDDLVTR